MKNPPRLSSEPDAPAEQIARISEALYRWNRDTTGIRDYHHETHTVQAPGLYQLLGYVVIAELEDYPPGHSQLIMRKDLG